MGSTPVHQDLVATSFQGRDDTGTENRTPDATLYEGESRCEIVDKDLRAVIEEDRWRHDSTPKASTKTEGKKKGSPSKWDVQEMPPLADAPPCKKVKQGSSHKKQSHKRRESEDSNTQQKWNETAVCDWKFL